MALTPRERRLVVLWAAVPVVVVTGLLVPFAFRGTVTATDVVGGVLVYGGLSAVTAAVVAFDRLQSRHCPACGDPSPRGTETCPTCAYDLEKQPRYACPERHRMHLEAGLCACGRRLQALERPRGIGREVKRMLWFGVWLFGVLVAVALLLPLVA